MARRIFLVGVSLLAVLLCVLPGPSSAADSHSLVGPKTYGMAGTMTSRPNGVASFANNPSAIGLINEFEVGVFYGEHILETDDFHDRFSAAAATDKTFADPIFTPEDVAAYREELLGLNEDGVRTWGAEHFGLAVGLRGFVFSAMQYNMFESDVFVDTANLNTDLTAADSLSKNQSLLRTRGLEMTELGLNFAYPVGGVFIGTSTRYLSSKTFWSDVTLTGSGRSRENLRGDSFDGLEASDDAVTSDFSLLWLNAGGSLGFVAKNVFSPELNADGKPGFDLEPQYKVGLSIAIAPQINISVDYDLRRYESFGLDQEIQNLSGGAELAFGERETFVLNIGVTRNTAAEFPDLTYGLSARLRLGPVILEAGMLRSGFDSPISFATGLRLSR